MKIIRFITAVAYYIVGMLLIFGIFAVIFKDVPSQGPVITNMAGFALVAGGIWLLRYLRQKYWLSRRKD